MGLDIDPQVVDFFVTSPDGSEEPAPGFRTIPDWAREMGISISTAKRRVEEAYESSDWEVERKIYKKKGRDGRARPYAHFRITPAEK